MMSALLLTHSFRSRQCVGWLACLLLAASPATLLAEAIGTPRHTAPPAAAGCSRAMRAPVSATGASVIVHGATISGIFPDVLRSIGSENGCDFTFSSVPRARLEAMFQAGRADLLMPAVRTPQRDVYGEFVPLVRNRALLMSMRGAPAPISSLAELRRRRELRVAVVRGYDYGAIYTALLKDLGEQGRLYEEVDASTVARLLQGGYIDATIMSATIMAGAVQADPRLTGLLDKLRLEPVAELPWMEMGVYISKQTVGAADRTALRHVFDQSAHSGQMMAGFLHHYRADVVKLSIRP